MNDVRTLSDIAVEIRKDWVRLSPYAEPYLDAMFQLSSVHHSYGAESGDSIVRYFLVNAGTWRGETARRVKAELKSML